MRYIRNRENSRRDLGSYISNFFENSYRSVKDNLGKAACAAAVTGILLAPGCASTQQRESWRETEKRSAGEIVRREPSTFDRYFNWSARKVAGGVDRIGDTGVEEWLDRQHPAVRTLIGGIVNGLAAYAANEFYDKNIRSHTGGGPKPNIGPRIKGDPNGNGDVGDPAQTPVGPIPRGGLGDVGD